MQGSHQSLRFLNRGPSNSVKLAIFSALALILLIVDARFRYLESTRSTLSIVISPIQQLASMPENAWHSSKIFFTDQQSLAEQNQELKRQQQHNSAQLSQFEALQLENQQLRKLLELSKRATIKTHAAEIIYGERNVFKRKILLNKGMGHDIQAGQIVMDENGIIGQITRTFPGLSEVTLITEPNHAVPVQVVRNGMRSIVFGAGDTNHMLLRYMPTNVDVRTGDILVTSGIDGIYPIGIPVAQVVKVERDASYPFARIFCLPLGGVDKNRHVLILSSDAQLPKRPDELSDTQ